MFLAVLFAVEISVLTMYSGVNLKSLPDTLALIASVTTFLAVAFMSAKPGMSKPI